MIVAYADASVGEEWVGIGWVLFRVTPTAKKTFIESGGRFFEREMNGIRYHSTEAEYRALISAARAATDHGNSGLFLYTDADHVVRKVRQRQFIHRTHYFRHALFSFVERFDHWDIEAIHRSENEIAHNQARSQLDISRYVDSGGVEV